jgi:1-acyl-sn-glycerol-3-phosphate acyltransferase
MRWEITGLENVPAEGGYVYAANHQSLLDILILGASLKGDFKWGAKRSLMRVPFLGWHLRLAGHVLVDRSRGTRGAAETILRFQRVLDSGKPLLLFPEGTRSPDGEVKPFKTGGFRAAVRAGVPVVPVALEGTASIMHKGAADAGDQEVRTRPVLIRVGAPLVARPEGPEKERVADLCERVHAAVLAMHAELRAVGVLDDSRV